MIEFYESIIDKYGSTISEKQIKKLEEEGEAGAANDVSGLISFYADDAGQNNQEFARITGRVVDATAGGEEGALDFYVAELDGTVTGEHGIGINKKEYLIKQHEDNIPLMQLIKKNIDPNNIMNPGKIFDIN